MSKLIQSQNFALCLSAQALSFTTAKSHDVLSTLDGCKNYSMIKIACPY